MFEERADMTREDWYRTPDFIILRFLNNMAAGLGYKAQEMRDVLELIASIRPDITYSDKFNVVERQLRVVKLEADRLWTECRRLADMLTPTTSDSPNTKTPPQQDQHQD